MVTAKSNMYASAKTWNPFKGCGFDCTYCAPSFKQQSKRQKHLCPDCYAYTPHSHPNRLKTIPATEIVFVCGNSDISFCEPAFTRQIIERIAEHRPKSPKTFYLQSKRPEYFAQFVSEFPKSVVLLTTLETNRDRPAVSKAPVPSERYRQFKALNYGRKVVTIEPVMDFDVDVLFGWIRNLDVEYIHLGLNSKPKPKLPEPSPEKLKEFVGLLRKAGIEIRRKELRGLAV